MRCVGKIFLYLVSIILLMIFLFSIYFCYMMFVKNLLTKYGVVDTTGKQVIQCKYDHITPHCKHHFYRSCKYGNNNTFSISKGWTQGLLDENANIILPVKYLDIIELNDNLFLVATLNEDNFKLIRNDLKKEHKLSISKDMFTNKISVISSMKRNWICEYINEFQYAEIIVYRFSYGVVDRRNNVIMPCVYNRDSKIISYIIEYNSYISPDIFYKYDAVYGESRGIIKVCLNNRYGFIDKKGKIVVPIIYDKIVDSDNKVIKGYKDNKWFIINPKIDNRISAKSEEYKPSHVKIVKTTNLLNIFK